MAKIVSDKEQRKAEREFAKNKKVVEKIERTGKDIDYNFYSVELPDIRKSEDGSWVFGGEYIDIDTIEDFRLYAEDNNELFEIIKAQYPQIISTIYRQAISNLSDRNKKTIASKMLNGETFDLDKIAASTATYEWGRQTPTISYILSKVNGDKKSGKPVAIKPYKKAKKEVMNYLNGGREQRGFFLPEITENGLVVTPTKDKRLSPRFFAVGENEYTEEQVREYLLANAVTTAERYGSSESAERERQDIVNAIIERAMLGYDAIINEDPRTLQIATEEMNYLCSIIYEPDFSVIEQKEAVKRAKAVSTGLGGKDKFDTTRRVDDAFVPDDDLIDVLDDETGKRAKLSEIVIEGDTNTKTKYDASRGVVTLVLSNDGGLHYETNFEENGKVLRATPINENANQKQ